MTSSDYAWFNKLKENITFFILLSGAIITIISQWVIFGQDIRTHEQRIAKLESQYIAQSETLGEVNERLASIDTSLDFLVGFFRGVNNVEIQQ